LKTLKISEDVHSKLTSFLGELVAQTAKMQTYQDAIEAMLSQSIILPPDLLKEVEDFIEENKQLGFTTRDEFMRDAARWRLKSFTEDYESVEIPKEKYEKLKTALEEMDSPYYNVSDLVERQIDDVLEKYDAWIEEGSKNRATKKT
jgi:hypothetical protein